MQTFRIYCLLKQQMNNKKIELKAKHVEEFFSFFISTISKEEIKVFKCFFA
jgi:hypothetical protein